MSFLDNTPNLYFVLWDNEPNYGNERTRIWVVQPRRDPIFREICEKWYDQKATGIIRSSNFQLHAPINENTNIFRNQCGSLYYPLLFEATWIENTYIVDYYEPRTITSGFCQYI